MESIQKIQEVLDSAHADVEKFNNGNKSAGTRIRKAMQEIKSAAQDVRKDVLNLRNTDG